MPDPTYHVLLIGIDSYRVKPLRGCVNDIDGVQRLLLDEGRVEIPRENITRLASPHAGARHETAVESAPATLANIRAALGRLGSAAVGPNDLLRPYDHSAAPGRRPMSSGTKVSSSFAARTRSATST
jgi:hypothetical protein